MKLIIFGKLFKELFTSFWLYVALMWTVRLYFAVSTACQSRSTRFTESFKRTKERNFVSNFIVINPIVCWTMANDRRECNLPLPEIKLCNRHMAPSTNSRIHILSLDQIELMNCNSSKNVSIYDSNSWKSLKFMEIWLLLGEYDETFGIDVDRFYLWERHLYNYEVWLIKHD